MALREFGVIPHVKYCRRKWVTNFVIKKTYLSFLNYFSTTSFAIALKVSSSGRKRIFLIMPGKCPDFSMRIRLRTRGKLMLANIRLKIRAVRDSDIDNRFLIFLTNNRLLAGTIYIRFLIYLKAVYEQKMNDIYFQLLPRN